MPTQAEIRTSLAKDSLRHYARQAWPIIEPSTGFTAGWHIEAIVEHLEAVSAGQIRKLLINMPPRHMKSILVSVLWPTWEWISKPEVRWLFASYAQSLSTRDSLKCRRIIESPWYRERWGQVYQLTGDQNVKTRYDNTRTGYRIATSVGGAATGEGGDRLIIDDPHNVKEAPSDLIRESTLLWWRESMSTRGNDPRTVAKVIVMQRVHERDLTGYLLAEEGDWDHLCLPAEYEPKVQITSIGWSDPRTTDGELLWPERFGPAEMAELKKSLGSYGSAGQLQQRPSPPEGGIFKRHWWRYWQPKGANLPGVMVKRQDGSLELIEAIELPDVFDLQAQSWDLAFKDTKDSAYVVGQVWGRVKADKFILDQVRDRLDFVATCQALKVLTAKWPKATAKWIEDKANGPAVIASMKREIAGIIAIEPMGDKVSRAHAVTPEVESGNVYLPHPYLAPWVEGFIEEHATFPNGSFKDQVDTTTQALAKMADTLADPGVLDLDFGAGQSTWAGLM